MNFTNYLKTLKRNYDSLSLSYRRGDFESKVPFKMLKLNLSITERAKELARSVVQHNQKDELVSFREAAANLYEQAIAGEEYKDDAGVSSDDKEEIAAYKLHALTLAYEVSDYFMQVTDLMSERFEELAREVSKNATAYYKKHYDFVRTPALKVDIVKQLVFGALCGVNSLYRKHEAAGFAAGVKHIERLVAFMEGKFLDFCRRSHPPFGLLGLAYFLKGRLLLGEALYAEADDCFHLSSGYYLKTLSNNVGPLRTSEATDTQQTNPASPAVVDNAIQADEDFVAVPVTELLSMRRAAMTLAFGSGYSALINSRVKEANKLLTLARGILHFNSPRVYAYYTELLYWSTRRAESSNDLQVLEEARRRVEECRRVFREHDSESSSESHYTHRASIEISLVLHYLAQLAPAKKTEYYKEAIGGLKRAVTFGEGKGPNRRRNNQILSEVYYILSHILRYQSADFFHSNPEEAKAKLKAACSYARKAEKAAKGFPRHQCEALLALCGVYSEVMRQRLPLPEVDSECAPGESSGSLLTNKALEALRINKEGGNRRISAICHLRLVDHYLKDEKTHSMAYVHWDEWRQLESSIEHTFVKDWAKRAEAELDKTRKRTLILKFTNSDNVSDLRVDLNVFLAKNIIERWANDNFKNYKIDRNRLVVNNQGKKKGNPGKLSTDLEKDLAVALAESHEEVKKLLLDHGLLQLAESLVRSRLSLQQAQKGTNETSPPNEQSS